MMDVLIKNPLKPNPRSTALGVLCRYFSSGGSLKSYLGDAFLEKDLSALDRRFIFNLVKGTVRYYILLDFIISLFSSRKTVDLDPHILNILRMGVYQIMFLDRVPDYSVVDESVKLAKKGQGIPPSRFVNAVLRKITGTGNIYGYTEEILAGSKKPPAEIIGIRHSYPLWLVKYWIKNYGEEKTENICSILNSAPVFHIRLNRLKILNDRQVREVNDKLKLTIPGIRPVKDIKFKGVQYDLEDALSISSSLEIEKNRLYREGYITVQNLPSQVAVKYFMEPEPREKVLDICAAPGGKTSYMAQLMQNRGRIVSVDISRPRIEMLGQNISRMGVENTEIVHGDATRKNFLKSIVKTDYERKLGKYNLSGGFDRIMVDAPCSSLGTAAKNPEVKYKHGMESIKRLADMQYRILVNSGRYIKPGGRMVYYTCTLSPLENQLLIERFLSESRGGFIMDTDVFYSGKNNNGKSSCLEIMPSVPGGEAAFIAVLKKIM